MPVGKGGDASRQQQAGHVLAELAQGRVIPPAGQVYVSLERGEVTWPDPSTLARRDDVAQQLWRDSAQLAGLVL